MSKALTPLNRLKTATVIKGKGSTWIKYTVKVTLHTLTKFAGNKVRETTGSLNTSRKQHCRKCYLLPIPCLEKVRQSTGIASVKG